MAPQAKEDDTRVTDSFTEGGNRANPIPATRDCDILPHPLSGTFPPSLATLRERIPASWRHNVGYTFPAEHRGTDFAALRAAHAAGMTEAQLEEAEEDYYRTLENDRRRS